MLAMVWGAQIPRSEKHFLCRGAIEVAMGMPGESVAPEGGSVLLLYEQVLAAAGEACGGAVGLGAIRRKLLSSGHRDLTRRIDSMVKGRRAVAHPDCRLPGEVALALEAGSVVGFDYEGGGADGKVEGGCDDGKVFEQDSRKAFKKFKEAGLVHSGDGEESGRIEGGTDDTTEFGMCCRMGSGQVGSGHDEGDDDKEIGKVQGGADDRVVGGCGDGKKFGKGCRKGSKKFEELGNGKEIGKVEGGADDDLEFGTFGKAEGGADGDLEFGTFGKAEGDADGDLEFGTVCRMDAGPGVGDCGGGGVFGKGEFSGEDDEVMQFAVEAGMKEASIEGSDGGCTENEEQGVTRADAEDAFQRFFDQLTESVAGRFDSMEARTREFVELSSSCALSAGERARKP